MLQDRGISVVVPVYNSEATLEELVRRLASALSESVETYEIMLVNDGSSDGSWRRLEELAKGPNRVSAVDLAHNFGQVNATLCGIQLARGEVVVTMDDDLQHPPEEVPKLLAAMAIGEFDVVFGAYDGPKASALRSAGTQLVRRLYRHAFPHAARVELTSFRALGPAAVAALKVTRTPNPMMNGIILSSTERIGNVTVRHDPRKIGRSGYRFSSMMRLVMNILFRYTTIPLRVVAGCGLAVTAVAFLAAIGWLMFAPAHAPARAPWAVVCLLVSLVGGSLIATMAVAAEYVRRLLDELSGRPPYVVRRIIGRGGES